MAKSNKGYEYERQLGQKYTNLNSAVAPRGSAGMDLTFFIKNTPILVEVKYTSSRSSAKNLNYGQTKFYQTQNGNWQFIEPRTEEEEFLS